uniref:terminase small subunit n=1 Tax=Leuconostoc carnosum TaxID=1252 RepID=UPI003F541E87
MEAGYKQAHVQGSQKLEKLSVKEYIAIGLKQVETTTQMSQTEALELLAKFTRGDVKETVVVGTPMGAETVEKELDRKTQLNAIKEVLRFSKFSNDITEQQVRKAKADADMAEAKVKLLDGNNGEIQPEG